ncbi:Fic family protein [Dethiosulfovibrio salsuginis]|uniref:Fic family protein n=1 Tax=Dethiosulfovibrio salsuginis TaxID=561720 RepID=A0A1X7JX02_9BACT|nr:Fic family protein [Dethiosulfovibrio salsuginis]SMG33044.1 Fic family protein [Dethiosulfovibrio salsuginis]
MRKYMTCKSGPFYFSERYNEEILSLPLLVATMLNQTVADLPILPRKVSQLETELIRQSIFGTAAIEGNPLSQEDVVGIIENDQVADVMPKSEMEIRNLVKAYELLSNIKPTGGPFILEESLITELHRIVTAGIRYDFNEPGRYRNETVGYTEVGDKAHGGVYRPPRILKDIKDLMGEYVEWVNSEELISKGPFVRAILAHYHFALIHPFFDGNGRTARLIEAILLQAANVRYVPKMLSNYYYRNIDGYYSAFSQTIKLKGKDVTPFLRFAVEGVTESLLDIKDRITDLIKKLVFREHLAQLKAQREITVRQFDLLSLLLDDIRVFSLNDLMEERPFSLLYRKVTKQTARRDVKGLLELGLIVKAGESRYSLNLDGLKA